MATNGGASAWQWSPEHKRYYRVTTDESGQQTYEWGPETSTEQSPTIIQHTRVDSGHAGQSQSSDAYAPTQNSYSNPQSGYQQTQGGHQQLQSSFQPTWSSYQQPQSSYQQSQSGYQQPQSGYQQPQSGYQQPTSAVASTGYYQSPASGYTPASTAALSHDYTSPTTQAAQSAPQAVPPAPVDQGVRAAQPNFIPGTPQQGWYETLDPSYRMRTGYEAYDFFKLGRVFSMLYTEAASGNAPVDDSGFTVVRFNERAYTQIRRFAIVAVKRGFVYACAISTYNGRATTKPGCIPAEHSIVYFPGTNPNGCYVSGESRMEKEPIKIIPTDPHEIMRRESRLRFGKTFSIEMNVKVKDIGRVCEEDRSNLVAYWRDHL